MLPTRANQRSTYQLRIALRDSQPLIKRTVEVTADTTLHKLHWVIQLAMGWTNSHLHLFVIGNERYSQPEFDEGELGTLDEHPVRLRDVMWQQGAVFAYQYDFGDNWRHDIAVEAIYPRRIGERYPRCIGGQGACPPEDCGGIYGYQELVEALGDPDHPEHATSTTRVGGRFDPERFDLDEVNRRLQKLWHRQTLDDVADE